MSHPMRKHIPKVQANSAVSVVANKGRTITEKKVKVGPEEAFKMLNADKLLQNRKVSDRDVRKYARDMATGKWVDNGDALRFSWDGDLMDGQHRLWAVIESKTPIEFRVIEGLDPDAMRTIDTGKKRSYGDVLTIEGKSYAREVAAALSWFAWWPERNKRVFRSIQATHSELADVQNMNPDVYDCAVEVRTKAKKAVKLIAPSVLTFCYTLFHRADIPMAETWLELLNSGAGMEENHPILQLRERMVKNRASKAKLEVMDICALVIKSWNQFKTGKRTVSLRWTSQEDFPEVEGLKEKK